MKFNERAKEILKESLLEGQSDYSDVMDALTKLETTVKDFAQIYPMDRGHHIHAAYKAEIDRVIKRFEAWSTAQTKFVAKKNKDNVNPDTVGESQKTP
jgi:hypothetical protein